MILYTVVSVEDVFLNKGQEIKADANPPSTNPFDYLSRGDIKRDEYANCEKTRLLI